MKPPAGLWAVWVPVGGQAYAATGAAPMLETRDATGMDTLLASQSVHRPAKSGTLSSRRPGQSVPLGRSQSPVCDQFCQERAHAGRCCLCGYLIRLPLFRLLLSSMGTV